MFIKKTKVRSGNQTYTYLQLVESVWKGGRPTHRVVANLGREDQIDSGQVDRLIAALAPYGGEEVLRAESLRIPGARQYGSLLALQALWDELQLREIMGDAAADRRHGFDFDAAVRAMTWARVLNPGSEQGVLRWTKTVYAPDLARLELQHLYRALDLLVEEQERIEARLAQVLSERLVTDLSLVLFDTTSIYFEGEGPSGLARHGYSRDRRSDRPQAVLGLLTTGDGFPLSHVVLPGDTSDLAAMREALDVVRRRLPVTEVVMVTDRGMVSEANLREMESLGMRYIVGAKFRHLATREVLHRAGRYREVTPNLLVKEAHGTGRRTVICYNPEEAERDRREREAMVAYLEQSLEDRGLKGLLKNDVARRYLKVKGETVTVDRRRIAQDALKDGKWVLLTNCSLPAREVALAYKGLWRVERAFRTLKTPLEIRPVYHWTDRRVRGHVAVCVLAYLLERVLEHKLESAGLKMSAAEALQELSAVHAVEAKLGKKKLVYRTDLTLRQEQILSACQVQLPPQMQTA